MKDLLENFVIISPDCSGMWLYTDFYPEKDREFIEYNTPLIGHWFRNDLDYIKFCESYDHYMRSIPKVAKDGYEFEGLTKTIQMIHDDTTKEKQMLNKWKGRAILGEGKKKIFIWSGGSFTDDHSEAERKDLIERFKKLDGFSIFLTEREDEQCEGESFIVKFIPDWKGRTQNEREQNATTTRLVWNIMFGERGVGPTDVYVNIIKEKLIAPLAQSGESI